MRTATLFPRFLLILSALLSVAGAGRAAEALPAPAGSVVPSIPDGIIEINDIQDTFSALWLRNGKRPLILLYGGFHGTSPHEGILRHNLMRMKIESGGGDATGTLEIVEEIERLRREAPEDTTIVIEGEWGPVIGLAYARIYRQHVAGVAVPPSRQSPGGRGAAAPDYPGDPIIVDSQDAWVDILQRHLRGNPSAPGHPPGDASSERRRREEDSTFKDAMVRAMSALAVILGF